MAVVATYGGDQRVARLRGDACNPCPDIRVRRQAEAAFLGDVRVRIQRDVSKAVALRHEKLVTLEPPLEHAQRRMALGQLLGQQVAELRRGLAQRCEPETGGAEIRFEVVLFEAQPLPHARALEFFIRDQVRVLGQKLDDGVALGQKLSAAEFEQRNPAGRIFGKELRGARGTAWDVHLDELVGDTQVLTDQPHLVAIARRQVVIQAVSRAHLTTCMRLLAREMPSTPLRTTSMTVPNEATAAMNSPTADSVPVSSTM